MDDDGYDVQFYAKGEWTHLIYMYRYGEAVAEMFDEWRDDPDFSHRVLDMRSGIVVAYIGSNKYE